MNISLTARRVRRLLNQKTGSHQGRKARIPQWAAVAAALWLASAVNIQRTVLADGDPPSVPGDHFGFISASANPDTITAESAEQLERSFLDGAAEGGERAWAAALHYCYVRSLEDRRVRLVFWLIDHHPDSLVHGYDTAAILPSGPHGDSARAEAARQRWLEQVKRYPKAPVVLVNAARAVGLSSRRDEIALRKRARSLDHRRTEGLARLYSTLLVSSAGRHLRIADPALPNEIRAELELSNDCALVGMVARYVVEGAVRSEFLRRGDWDFRRLKTLAGELVTHAMELEPGNETWRDLSRRVQALSGGA
jgi:hypothetical protein